MAIHQNFLKLTKDHLTPTIWLAYFMIFFFDMTIQVYMKSVCDFPNNCDASLISLNNDLSKKLELDPPSCLQIHVVQRMKKTDGWLRTLLYLFQRVQIGYKNEFYESPNLSDYEYNLLLLMYILMLNAIKHDLTKLRKNFLGCSLN